MSRKSYFNAILIVLILLVSCFKPFQVEKKPDILTFHKIQSRGILKAVTIKSSTSYFIYKGMPMGFHYELLHHFADYLGVKLQIKTVSFPEEAFKLVKSGEYDLIAFDLAVNEKRKEFLDFSIPLFITEEVLVWHNSKKNPFKDKIQPDAEIHLPATSYFDETSVQFKDFKNFKFTREDQFLPEDLIRLVAEKKISYTICNKIIAEALCQGYKNINYTSIKGQTIEYGWAVNKNSTLFLKELNSWLTELKETALYKYWFRKYYQSPQNQKFISDYLASADSRRISKYDHLLKKYAIQIGWDWRLLASLIYQESQFKENLVSKKGAFGLMQMMPETAENFGIDINSGVEAQIIAGVRYIRYLDQCFKMIPDSAERIKFILAAYNSGPGHVFDAIRLTEKFHKNKYYWDQNVDSFMLRKAYPKYYRDPVVKNGYSRGHESFKLVKEVIERYYHYKNLVPG